MVLFTKKKYSQNKRLKSTNNIDFSVSGADERKSTKKPLKMQNWPKNNKKKVVFKAKLIKKLTRKAKKYQQEKTSNKKSWLKNDIYKEEMIWKKREKEVFQEQNWLKSQLERLNSSNKRKRLANKARANQRAKAKKIAFSKAKLIRKSQLKKLKRCGI